MCVCECEREDGRSAGRAKKDQLNFKAEKSASNLAINFIITFSVGFFFLSLSPVEMEHISGVAMLENS